MSEFRIASRYAKALLQLAEERKCLDEVMKDMTSFTTVCKENRDFVLLLKNPIASSYKKLAIIKQIFDGKVNEMTFGIFDILTRKNREMYLPEVALAFREQYHTVKGIVESTITTVSPISAAIKKDISAVVKNITNSEVVLTEKIDPSIIGGFVLRIGDKQIDDSVSAKLRELKLQLTDKNYINKL